MILTSGTNSLWKRRFIRAVAVFFLLYVGVDVATPQLCGEEAQRLALSGSAPLSDEGRTGRAVLDLASNFSSDDSQSNTSPDQPHQEDCLGCCAHVLPGKEFACVAVSDLRLPPVPSAFSPDPSPPLRGTYHPPRLS